MSYKVVDLRGVIPGNPQSDIGSRAKTGGIIVHYNGPPTGVPFGSTSVRRQLANDARYHMRPGVFEARAQNGIQYHLAVWEGVVYILRNPGSVLYHCGAWPQNAVATAIHVPIGGNQRATKRTIQTLTELCNYLLGRRNLGRAYVGGEAIRR